MNKTLLSTVALTALCASTAFADVHNISATKKGPNTYEDGNSQIIITTTNCFHDIHNLEDATLDLNGFDDKIIFHNDGTECQIVKIYNKSTLITHEYTKN